ncbi:TPA: hypothetical protein ACIJW8_004955, partial [Klebsiella aerogenes]
PLSNCIGERNHISLLNINSIYNSTESLNSSDYESGPELETVLAIGEEIQNQVSLLNSPQNEMATSSNRLKGRGWKTKTVCTLGLLSASILAGKTLYGSRNNKTMQPHSFENQRDLNFPQALPSTMQKNESLAGSVNATNQYLSLNKEKILSSISPSFTINLTGAVPTGIKTATSSGGGFYKLGDKKYFVKPGVAHIPLTPEKQAYFALSEVASNSVTRLLATGTEGAPKSFVGEISGIPYIATEAIDYNDIGNFFRKESIINEFARSHPEMKQEDVIKLKENALKISDHYNRMRNLEKSKLSDWWKTKEQKFINDYRAEAQPHRDLIIEGLKMLPIEFQKAVQEHIIIGQIVGDWDFLNERFENIGISKNTDGQYRVASLDRGISFGVGFWGSSKPEGYNLAVSQRPPAFLPLNTTFTQEKSLFGSYLPELGKDFSFIPYADVAKLASGNTEWIAENINKIAYRITIINEQSLISKILNDTLVDPSKAGLEGHHFLDKEQTKRIMEARLSDVIRQAGGYDEVVLWAQQNPAKAAKIREEVNGVRQSLGY